MNPNIDCGECPVILFDMSILDVNERREKGVVYDTTTKCANFLGYTTRSLTQRIKDKHYVYHKETKHKYAVRRQTIKSTV